MSYSEGMRALQGGAFDQAERFFSSLKSSNPGASRRGLAKVLIALDQLEDARTMIEVNLQNAVPADIAIYGDIIGKQGSRDVAQGILERFLSSQEDPYVRAVLAEQYVRQGEWNQGTLMFVQAVQADKLGEASQHLKQVVSDLSIAVANGRLPGKLAVRFVQQLNSKLDGAIKGELGPAQAAIQRGQVWHPRVSAVPAPPPQPPRAVSSAYAKSNQPKHIHEIPPRSTKLPALIAVMRRDRELNEELQNEVQDVGFPEWPSSRNALDPIPVMRPQLLNFSKEELADASVRLTSGVIGNEIMVERAVGRLLHAATGYTRSPLDYSPDSLTRLELMMWDGLLDQLAVLPDVYLQDQSVTSDVRLLALAGFLGNLIVRMFDGVWAFDQRIEQSVVHIDTKVVQPFQIAARWLAAKNPDDVELYRIIDDAAVGTRANFVRTHARIDETEALKDASLQMKLAELWLQYLGRPPEQTRHASESIQILQNTPLAICFALDSKYAPKKPVNPAGEVHGLAMIAYDRRTGSFFLLRSTKQMAMMLNVYVPVFKESLTKTVGMLFDNLHAPAIELSHPVVNAKAGGVYDLVVNGRLKEREFTWVLTYTPNERPWEIDLVSG